MKSLLVDILFGFDFTGDYDSVNSEAIYKRHCQKFEGLMKKIWQLYERFIVKGIKLIRYPISTCLCLDIAVKFVLNDFGISS